MQTPEQDIEAVLKESGPEYEGFQFETPGGGHQSDVYMVTLRHNGEAFSEANIGQQLAMRDLMADLRAAGIKIWMLTGDKLETAVVVARNAAKGSLTRRGRGRGCSCCRRRSP